MIAIDNPVLQVQIRTRPRRWYSTITQVAIEIKDTGEVFRGKLDGQVESTIGNLGAGPATYSHSGSSHTVHLGGLLPASYIRVHLESYGISMTAYGCAYFFAGSEGMCGSWDSNGVRFRDGTNMTNTWNTIALAIDWQIPSGQSLLWNPSTICDPSPRCGPGELFACEDWRRQLREVNPGCTNSCSDIGIQQFSEQCKRDIDITGDSSWACAGAYEDPIIATDRVIANTTTPPPTPHPVGINGGCYKSYVDGSSYAIGDWVSTAVIITSNPIYTMDPITGVWQTETPTTETKRNFNCISKYWCGVTGYGPGSSGESLAWKEGIGCLGVATPATAPIPPLWNIQGGCPKTHEAGTTYNAGDVVSVDSLVYRCAIKPMNQFCGQIGYAPGTAQYWDVAWTLSGSCVGTLVPTSAPNYVALAHLGGCPEEWEEKIAGEAYYEEGDTVSSKGLVFSCKTWPHSMHCNQQGYGPLENPATDAWTDAWKLIGYCKGVRLPTSSPTFDPANSVGACPNDWSAGNIVKYEEGDMVSATVSSTPLQKVAFLCKPWPFSGYCGQFSPTNNFGGWLGWRQIGACSGTSTPTIAPVMYVGPCKHNKCVEVDDTMQCTPGSTRCSCNINDTTGPSCQRTIRRDICSDMDVNRWSDNVDYTAGDVVRIGSRRFKCREWPVTLWCNLEAYTPMLESGIWDQAWSEDGTCM